MVYSVVVQGQSAHAVRHLVYSAVNRFKIRFFFLEILADSYGHQLKNFKSALKGF